MGVALSVCTLPGQVTSDRLGPKQMELGLGIVSLNHINYYARIIKQLAYFGVVVRFCALMFVFYISEINKSEIKTSICFQHGEPGVAVVELQPIDVVVEHVLKQILSQVSF